MKLSVIFIQLLLSLPLLGIMEYFNNKKISNIQKILIPVIYIVIVSGLCMDIKDNIYLIVIFQVVMHEFYINNVTGNNLLINKKEYLINSLVSVILSIFIYNYYISKVDSILPLPNEFRSILWFLIIIFIYCLLKEHLKVSSPNNVSFIERKREYVIVMYAKLKNRYFKVVKSKKDLVNKLIYAMMIYENYTHPLISRKITVIKRKIFENTYHYGIMQVESNQEIDDEESIRRRMDEIEKIITKKSNKSKNDIRSILEEIYSDTNKINNICDIYDEIISFENK